MKHEALLNLLSEVTAQRDDYVAWQAHVLSRIGKLVDGQPEVRPGLSVLDVLDAYVARLVREREKACKAAEPHADLNGAHRLEAVLPGTILPGG